MDALGKNLVMLGLLLAGVGALLWFFGRHGGGLLPGAIAIERKNVRIYFPIVTCLVVSLILSFLARGGTGTRDFLARDPMPSAETANHARLKTLTLGWAQENGFAISGLEVRVPRSGYGADVAACGRGTSGRTAVFECKQARS